MVVGLLGGEYQVKKETQNPNDNINGQSQIQKCEREVTILSINIFFLLKSLNSCTQ